MKVLIIPEDRVGKIKNMNFGGLHNLFPVEGEMDGKKIHYLFADLKENKIFAKALADFEASEIKEIETIEDKFFDSKNVEIAQVEGKYLDSKGKELNIFELNRKTVLTAKILKK
jgi:hypothetical protein